MADSTQSNEALLAEIRDYWNERIHDLAIATSPIGTPGFFNELEAYRFEKLDYLPKVVHFDDYRGKKLLEVGCGVGTDLAHFVRAGATSVGVDLSERAVELARQNLAHQALLAELHVMNGEALEFANNSFDVVYAHGVLQYTADPAQMIEEIVRVLRPGGEAILMVYNRRSWLNALSKLMAVELEHADAPVLRKYTAEEFRKLLSPFSQIQIIPERFPVPTLLHRGWKAALYNSIFVAAFNRLPRPLVRPFGWHLMAFATKAQ
jgi:SAM-dependent methyltransferase